MANDCETAKALLQNDFGLLKKSIGGWGNTAWHVAAKNGHVGLLCLFGETVRNASPHDFSMVATKRFLKNGAEETSPDQVLQEFLQLKYSGCTPLILAAQEGHAEAVTCLMELGADPWQGNKDTSMTPIHYAAMHGHSAAISELISNSGPPSPSALQNKWVKPECK